jgi:hypothetical protein
MASQIQAAIDRFKDAITSANMQEATIGDRRRWPPHAVKARWCAANLKAARCEGNQVAGMADL